MSSRQSRLLAAVLGCIVVVALLMQFGGMGRRRARPSHRPPVPVKPKAIDPADIVGKRLAPVSVRLADGSTLRLPDSKPVALWLGERDRAATAAGGLAQLAAALPELRAVVVCRPVTQPATLKLGDPPASSAALPVIDGPASDTIAKALGRLLGDGQRKACEWWLIEPTGRIGCYGELGASASMMEAELAWPLLEPTMATPADFKPTPVDKLCPDGANRKWSERLLPLWRRRLVDGYQQYGRHSDAWDKLAVAFLEQRSRALAGDPSAASATDLGDQADRLLALGCNDPVVVYQCTLAFAANGERHRNKLLRPRLAALSKDSKYPPRLLYAAACVGDDGSGSGPDSGQRWPYTLVGEALTPPFERDERRLDAEILAEENVLALYGDDGRGLPYSAAVALERPGVDLWFRAWIRAKQLGQAAWRARGGDWASNTSAEQFRGFEAGLAAETKALALALKLHPDHPEPAAMMVAVCQGSGEAEGERLWTERALGSDLTSGVTATYYVALWPRWGGSHEQMRALADENASDALLGTDRPLELWRVEHAIGSDENHGPKPSAERLDALLSTLDKMIAASPTQAQANRLRTYRLDVLVESGREQQAQAMLRELGDGLDFSAFSPRDYGCDEDLRAWLLEQVLGAGGMDHLTQLVNAGDTEAISELLTKADGKARLRLVRRWLADLRTLASASTGTSRPAPDATPSDSEQAWRQVPLTANLLDWQAEGGGAKPAGTMSDGALKLGAPAGPLTYITSMPPDVTVQLEAAATDGARLSVRLKAPGGDRDGHPLTLDLGAKRVGTGMGGADTEAGTVTLQPRDWHRLRLRVRGGRAEATFDDLPLAVRGQWPPKVGWRLTLTATGSGQVMLRKMQWRGAS